MAKKKLNSTQEQEICRLYLEERLSSFVLAEKFKCSAGTILNILHRKKVKLRTAGESKRALTPEDENEVCILYLEEKLNQPDLAKKYNCSQSTIKSIFLRKGIKSRKHGESNRTLTPEDEKEVCLLYENGINPKQISERYGCSTSTIRLTLKRNKIKTRTAGESRRRFTPEIEKEICNEYQDGSGTILLSKKFNCNKTTILRILERNNIQIRKRANWSKKTPEEEWEICRLYSEKKSMSTRKLAEKFDCDIGTIKSILKRNNIRIKSRGEWRQKESEEEQEICELYEEGLNTYEIGEKFNFSPHGIKGILKRHKIKIRDRSDAQWRYSMEEEQEICKLYEEGLDIRSIANKVGGGASTISRVLKRQNIQTRNIADYIKILSKDEGQEVCKLYCEGLSMSLIADKFKCSIGVIFRILKENKIKSRSLSETTRLENNPRWLGGISFEPYCPKFNDEFKERVRNYFDRYCMICGKKEEENGRRLSVHHVNYEKMVCCDGTLPLFLPLCHSCHVKTNQNREYWENILTEFIMIYFDGESYLPKS